MTKEILIILACVPLYVANSFCDKAISSKYGDRYSFIYNNIKFLFCSLCMLPILFFDDSPKFEWGCLLCGVACGLMYAVNKTVMLKGYERTSVAFMTLCHSSGMILPCVLGHFIWSERLSIIAIIGILFAIVSVVLLKDAKREKKGFDKISIIWGCIIFITSGGVMIVQKLMGVYFFEQSVISYNFYSFVIAFLILCIFPKPQKKSNANTKCICLLAVGSAISLSAISLIMTSLAGNVPSVILFPLFNGLGIIFVCIGSAFVFKEKLTTKKILGLILGILGLCLTNF